MKNVKKKEKVLMQRSNSDTIRLPQAIRSGLRLLDRLSPAIAGDVTLDLFLRVRRQPANYLSALPLGAQQISVYHNLRKLAGYEWQNDGRTVLLVHGWESNLGQLLSFVEPLLRRSFRVLAFDAPGHGLSPSQPSHLIHMADAVQDIAEQHGPIHGIIAHDSGAAASLLAFQRGSALDPQKLALIAPMPDLDMHLHHFSETAALSGAMRTRLRSKVASYIGMPIDACNGVAATIKAHTLVVHDCDDQIVPVEAGFEIAKRLNAALVTTEHLGHQGILKDAQTVQRIADFMC
jgi:pimeloyl-ACP methyl ester carboxylesterase